MQKQKGLVQSPSFSRKKSGAGFTLIELLVVIAIIGILSAIIAPSFLSARREARNAQRQTHVNELILGLEFYFDENNGYPSALTELVPTYFSFLPADSINDPARNLVYQFAGTPTSYTIQFNMEPDSFGTNCPDFSFVSADGNWCVVNSL